MELRSSLPEGGPAAELIVRAPDGKTLGTVLLASERVTVGRLAANDVALQPDPDQLVTREGHCTLEREGGGWLVVDGGSVNGTFLRRGGELRPVTGRMLLHDGDVVCVLGTITEQGERRFFELAFRAPTDPQATRAAPIPEIVSASELAACLSYEPDEARLVLVAEGERHEIRVRAQAHRLLGYMAERNAAIGGAPALCTHDELISAVWKDEPMHTRVELARLIWELRRKLEPFGAEDLVENEPRRGYRLRTCPQQ
ncbi:MAG: transcriptional regulator [Candidatus Rokuibacteriota bacterium]|nr:MAG: transcriptional regulator [Candidatus Rokubacteria bacterium]